MAMHRRRITHSMWLVSAAALQRSEFRHLVVFLQTGEDACMTENSVSLQDEDAPGKSIHGTNYASYL